MTEGRELGMWFGRGEGLGGKFRAVVVLRTEMAGGGFEEG